MNPGSGREEKGLGSPAESGAAFFDVDAVAAWSKPKSACTIGNSPV